MRLRSIFLLTGLMATMACASRLRLEQSSGAGTHISTPDQSTHWSVPGHPWFLGGYLYEDVLLLVDERGTLLAFERTSGELVSRQRSPCLSRRPLGVNVSVTGGGDALVVSGDGTLCVQEIEVMKGAVIGLGSHWKVDTMLLPSAEFVVLPGSRDILALVDEGAAFSVRVAPWGTRTFTEVARHKKLGSGRLGAVAANPSGTRVAVQFGDAGCQHSSCSPHVAVLETGSMSLETAAFPARGPRAWAGDNVLMFMWKDQLCALEEGIRECFQRPSSSLPDFFVSHARVSQLAFVYREEVQILDVFPSGALRVLSSSLSAPRAQIISLQFDGNGWMLVIQSGLRLRYLDPPS